jgi:hypothetical protein
MRRGIAIYREQGALVWMSPAEGALAIAEASAGEIDAGSRAWTRSPSWSAPRSAFGRKSSRAAAEIEPVSRMLSSSSALPGPMRAPDSKTMLILT